MLPCRYLSCLWSNPEHQTFLRFHLLSISWLSAAAHWHIRQTVHSLWPEDGTVRCACRTSAEDLPQPAGSLPRQYPYPLRIPFSEVCISRTSPMLSSFRPRSLPYRKLQWSLHLPRSLPLLLPLQNQNIRVYQGCWSSYRPRQPGSRKCWWRKDVLSLPCRNHWSCCRLQLFPYGLSFLQDKPLPRQDLSCRIPHGLREPHCEFCQLCKRS